MSQKSEASWGTEVNLVRSPIRRPTAMLTSTFTSSEAVSDPVAVTASREVADAALVRPHLECSVGHNFLDVHMHLVPVYLFSRQRWWPGP